MFRGVGRASQDGVSPDVDAGGGFAFGRVESGKKPFMLPHSAEQISQGLAIPAQRLGV